MSASLVGSEMCIRDSVAVVDRVAPVALVALAVRATRVARVVRVDRVAPVSYTHLTLPTICSV
eukprot:3159332-Alexandrium_andersonii.AAC.1